MSALAQNQTQHPDHRLLCHRAGMGRRSAFDGVVGARVRFEGRAADEDYIITSPNYETIFLPPVGCDRCVFRRYNFRFGEDDPLVWPQPFIQEFPHYACIRRPSALEDVVSLIPDRSHMIEDGVFRNIGKLDPSILEQLVINAQVVLARAKPFGDVELVQRLSCLLRQHLKFLEWVPTVLEKMQVGVRETQRLITEILALADYHERFLPGMSSRLEPPTRVADVMGAFTSDLHVCDRLYRAGIPVWLMRPLRELPSIRVDRAVTAVPFDNMDVRNENAGLVLGKHGVRISNSWIFRGSPDQPEKYRAIHGYVERHFRYPNPFGSVRAELTIIPTFSQEGREQRRQLFSPYANNKKGKNRQLPAGRDKFKDPQSPIYPPGIPTWTAALQGIMRNTSQFRDSNVTDTGYVFPEPASFIALESDERRRSHFYAWLKYRNVLLFRMSNEEYHVATPMPNKEWRILLGLEYLKRGQREPSSSTMADMQETKTKKLRDAMYRFLQDCMDVAGIVVQDDDSATVQWNGIAFSSLGDKEFQEILWELAELNFRFELIALDVRMSGHEASDRQKQVAACFPECADGGSLLVVKLDQAGNGLASLNWEQKSIFLHALKRLIMTWEGPKSAIIESVKVRWSHVDIQELERVLAEFYVQSFYNCFRRAPIIPRRLSHAVTSADLIRPVNLPPVLNPTSPFYSDVTKFLPL